MTNRRRHAFSRKSEPARRSRPLTLERLEDRTLLSATLVLDGPQTIVPSANVAASSVQTTSESEMSVAINPTNPLNVIGFTHDVQNLSEIQVFYSMDGGLTWARTLLNGIGSANNDNQGSGGSVIRFDPTVSFAADGTAFIGYGAYSGGTTKLVIGRSVDGGASFANDAFRVIDTQSGYGGVDKFYLGLGPADASGTTQAIYVSWERPFLGYTIMVAGSNDGGDTFTAPTVLDSSGSSSFWATPAVGPNGELYVAWLSVTDNTIKSRVKPDGLWGSGDWNPTVVVKHLNRALAQFSVPPQSRRGIYTAPTIDVDRSGGPYTGRAYVAFIDQVSGTNTDVYLTYSDDLGASWSDVGPPGNVEDSPNSEFHTTVSVDQSSGSVTVLYRTNDGFDTDNHTSTVKVATSLDGGATFTKAELADQRSRALSALNSNEFGDYSGLNVYDGTIQGFWSDNRGATPGTYTSKLYAYSGSAAFQSATGTNTLYVVGNEVDYGPSPVNPDYLQVIADGQLVFAGLALSVDNIVVNAPPRSTGPVIHGSSPHVRVQVNWPASPALVTAPGGAATGGDNDPAEPAIRLGSNDLLGTFLAGSDMATPTAPVVPAATGRSPAVLMEASAVDDFLAHPFPPGKDEDIWTAGSPNG